MVTIVSCKKKFGDLHNFDLILVELDEVPIFHFENLFCCGEDQFED
jgi:hypothetical protein